MNIGLIQIDGTLPNLALMKLSAWHKSRGDKITLMKDKTIAQRLIPFDKVYISCIFEENKEISIKVSQQFKNCEIGGIGVNNIRLPEEIEHLMPDYKTFKCDYSLGFTTRGCIRNCYFCKVPKHEGRIRINCDIYEFWDRKHKEIIILDNNILALPEHFKKIAQQIKDNNLIVDFNQGLDHRLLTPEICRILLDLKHKQEIRFAFDDVVYKPTVIKAIKMLKEAGLRDWGSRWYVYVGEKDTFQSVYERMKLLKDEKQGVYIMRDRKVYNKKEFIILAAWGNMMGAFKQNLPELLEKSKRLKDYATYFKDVVSLNDSKKYNQKFKLKGYNTKL
jgi:hypothetical protein